MPEETQVTGAESRPNGSSPAHANGNGTTDKLAAPANAIEAPATIPSEVVILLPEADEDADVLAPDVHVDDAGRNGRWTNGDGPPANRGFGQGRGDGGRWRGRDLTNGSIPKNLFAQAWPQSVEGVLRVVQQMLDLVWAGFLGTGTIAG